MKHVTWNFLVKLLETGRITSSKIPKSALPEVERIKKQGFIDWNKAGRGGVYTIQDHDAIITLLKNTGYHGEIEELTSKAKAVALHKDAHKGRDEALLLLFSATQKVLWYKNGAPVDLYKIVQDCGIASILIKPGDNWQTDNPIALVENRDLLLYANQYFRRINFEGTIIHYPGWVSKKTIAWLKTLEKASVTIFPDYDPVGLKNYIILKKELPRLKIYIPEDLPELLVRFGDPERLNTLTDRKLLEQTKDENVAWLYKLLLKHGVGLHQEALMLSEESQPEF